MNSKSFLKALVGFIASAVTVVGLATPAAATDHAIVKNPFTPRGVSWVEVPDADRVWLQSGTDTSVDDEMDDDVFSYLSPGHTCTLGNGDLLTGPAIVDGDEDSDCANYSGEGSYTQIPIGFDINFGGKIQSGLFVNSNAAISFADSNAYDDPLHYSSQDDETSGLSVLGMDLGVFQGGTGSDLPGTNVWAAQTTVAGKQAFVVSWENLRSHGDNELTASVQLVILNDGEGDFTAWFNYDDFNVTDQGYGQGTFFTDLRNNPAEGVYKAYNIDFLQHEGVAYDNGCIDIGADTYDKYGNSTNGVSYLRIVDAAEGTVKFLDSCEDDPANDVAWVPGEDDRYVFSEEISTNYYDSGDSAPIGWAVYEFMEDGTLEWNATEFQYNIEIDTLGNEGSNPLINQSLNTEVPGRYVIGMRGGKTWGDPGITNGTDQEALVLTAGELVFDGKSTTPATTGGSGTGAVSYVVVSGPCEIVDGAVKATGLGTCVLKATKAADSEFNSATSEEVSFTVVEAELAPVDPSDDTYTVNGVEQSVAIEPTEGSTGLDVSGEGFTMRLIGTDSKGNALGVTSESALILEQSRLAQVSGTGFQANSVIKLYLHSTTVFLGTVTTDADGNFNGSVQIPMSVPVGNHHIQAAGYATDGSVRVLTLAVVLKAVSGAKSLKQYVFFAAGSAKLTNKAKLHLKKIAAQLAGSQTNKVFINGAVQKSGSSANDRRLAVLRAKAVRVYLLKQGIQGTIKLGVSKTSGASYKSRKVVIMANLQG